MSWGMTGTTLALRLTEKPTKRIDSDFSVFRDSALLASVAHVLPLGYYHSL